MHRRGFSLVELSIGLAITSILLAALGSVFVLAARGAEASADDRAAAATAALSAMAAELRDAVRITEAGPTAVTFQVADRTGDAVNEIIRYAWSGAGGDPLVRTVNGAPATAVAALDSLALSYATTTRTRTSTGPAVESAETLLASYTGAVGSTYSISSTNSLGQTFSAVIPPNATAWRITRLRLYLMRGTGNGNLLGIQLRTVPSGGSFATSSLLEEWVLATSSLSNGGRWETFSPTSATGLAPSALLGVVLSQRSGLLSTTAVIPYQSAGVADPDATMGGALLGGLGGITWTLYPEASMQYEVYGAYSTPSRTTRTDTLYTAVAIRATTPASTKRSGPVDFATTVNFPVGAEP